jgi:hypothetical protein
MPMQTVQTQPLSSSPTGSREATVVCYRGLRVRMGLHSGLDDERHILFNKPSGAFKYYGAPACRVAVRVCTT